MPDAEQLYMFRHAVVRDAAYSLYPPTTRAELHRLVIEATEAALPPQVLPAHAAELADHAKLAGEVLETESLRDCEVQYRAKAADYSASHDLLEDATRHLQRQTELTDERARPALLLRMGSYALAMGRMEVCMQYTREVERIGIEFNDSVALGMAKRGLGVVQASLGNREEGSALLEEAIELFRGTSNARELARTMNGKARLLIDSGRYMEAKELLAELSRTTDELDDPFQQALSCSSLAELQVRTGDAESALVNYQRASDLMTDNGPPRSVEVPKSGVAHALVLLGRLEEAERIVHPLIASARQSGRLSELSSGLEILAEAQSRAGNSAKAVVLRVEALDAARRHGARRLVGVATCNLGTHLVSRGALKDAEPLLLESLAIREEMRDNPGLGAAHLALGLLREKQGDCEQAANHFAMAVDIHERLGVRDRAEQSRAGLRRVTGGTNPA